MSNQGDDCYFFFYSTCSKGESCPFRHCKAALGNETVCTLWQEGRCFRQICKFRHMEIDKKRSMIPCFWENQLSGCQKGNCAFHHSKGRYIDGVYMPPSKKQIDEPEPSETDIQNFQTSSKFVVASTPHLREVIKTEAAENVPSPTHPPVVINAADDDEDDDDQISAEGDESKPSCQRGVHPGAQHVTTRKIEVLRKGPDFGIKTLEEKNSNWKNVIDLPKDEAPGTGRSLAQRLGKRKFFSQESSLGGEGIPIVKKTLSERLGKRVVSPIADLDVHHKKASGGEGIPIVKKTLSERLGKRVVSPIADLDVHHKKSRVTRPLKDRLGLSPEPNSTETGKADNTTTEFHIKTLQEIRQEKAGQRREEEPKGLPIKSKDHLCLKSSLSTKPQPIHVKSLHEIQVEKKQHQLLTGAQKAENKVDNTDSRERRDLQAPKKQDNNLRETEEKQRSEAGITCRVEVRKPLCVNLKETKKIDQSVEHVQIKTLEEIRKEKALKAQQNWRATDTKNLEPLSQLQVTSSEKRILRLSRSQVQKETDQGISDAKSQTNNTATALDTQTTVDIIPAVPAPATIFEKGVGEKTLEKQSADFTDIPEEPSKVIPEKIVKGKPKVNTEPNLMKKHSPAKTVIKRKAQQISPVAKVKPLNTTSTDKKKTILLPVSDSSVTQNVLETSTSSKLKKENCEAPASDPVHSSTTKTRRTSVASSAKPSVPAEDDFDELIWDISDGKLGDEINLDPSKDEDDLLMELSEMIDS